jgi:murein DD-endopeptidase / murein LD-carboxypeptidase
MKQIFLYSVLLTRAAMLLLLFTVFVLTFLPGCRGSRAAGDKKVKVTVQSMGHEPETATVRRSTGNYEPIQVEFAKKLGVEPDSIQNIRLYQFIKEWLGTVYLWGGDSKRGIDCSAFVQRLYNNVYNIQLPRTSITQFYASGVELYSKTKYLSEGDLVFFKTLPNDNAVTHVGFYLHNGYFVNASSSKGVSIASIYDEYWKYKYVASGRLKRSYYENR